MNNHNTKVLIQLYASRDVVHLKFISETIL